MIEWYKTINGKYDPACVLYFDFVELSGDFIRTKGNKYKLIQHHYYYDLCKFHCTNKLIPVWNSLSHFVGSSNTVNIFEYCLDKYWFDQDLKYNYKADLRGIGNRSIVN